MFSLCPSWAREKDSRQMNAVLMKKECKIETTRKSQRNRLTLPPSTSNPSFSSTAQVRLDSGRRTSLCVRRLFSFMCVVWVHRRPYTSSVNEQMQGIVGRMDVHPDSRFEAMRRFHGSAWPPSYCVMSWIGCLFCRCVILVFLYVCVVVVVVVVCCYLILN